jgi:hypothetical protein
VIPPGSKALSNGAEPPADDAAAKSARIAALMAFTPEGKAALAAMGKV